SAPSIEGRITNGKTATAGQFPYQVGLSFGSSAGSWWCGGSIIDNEWVLTAAHCTSGATSVTIYYGATVRTSAQVTLTVASSNFIQHASYNSIVLRNDISLIKTPSVSFTSDINKVELPKIAGTYSTYAGQTAIASGWGKESDAASSVASTLQYASFDIISVADCQKTYGSLIASSSVICIATPNRVSTCNGDSGGPLVLSSDKILVGVTSFVSSAGCESGDAAGFTRVTAFVSWIKEKSDGEQRSVPKENIKQHSDYNENTLVADISLILLPQPLEFGLTIDKVGLPPLTGPQDTYEGQEAMVSGWGLTNDHAIAQPLFLKYANVNVISNAACNSAYPGFIKPSHLCTATTSGQGTCFGDSGGPLTVDDGSMERIQIGIVSFGSSKGCTAAPSAYTRVTAFRQWIENNMY
ncbi:hypothetical protein KR038_007467, partial [Drosophila bunnanda]